MLTSSAQEGHPVQHPSSRKHYEARPSLKPWPWPVQNLIPIDYAPVTPCSPKHGEPSARGALRRGLSCRHGNVARCGRHRLQKAPAARRWIPNGLTASCPRGDPAPAALSRPPAPGPRAWGGALGARAAACARGAAPRAPQRGLRRKTTGARQTRAIRTARKVARFAPPQGSPAALQAGAAPGRGGRALASLRWRICACYPPIICHTGMRS